MEFSEFFETATGNPPYPWQRRIADAGLPEVIDIETGAGKTAGVVLGWLYRLLRHPDQAVRAGTPAWLVFALPMRSLVDQTERAIGGWLERLDAADVGVYRLLGGEGRLDSTWRENPGRPTILVGTVDMVLSRALMRGYASSRWTWPVEYGLLHAGCHYVFDEVQLLGPALPTSRQLDAFRREFGVAAPCSSTWMSATLDPVRLITVDNPTVPVAETLQEDDRCAGLERRLSATRRFEERPDGEPKAVAAVAISEHRPETLTLVVVNTVRRAREVYAEVKKQLGKDPGPELALLHSRFRPADRSKIVREALRAVVAGDGPGRILVATQVVEAGIDVSAATLITDAAPWSSIVQRSGRCNRAGEFTGARVLWVEPPQALPYSDDDLAASVEELRSLEGTDVTSTRLRERGREVVEAEPLVPVLRRRDLIDLFDTSPDLVGNDIDVARFIRADGDTDVQVAWREPAPDGQEGEWFTGGPIRPDELCRVSIGDARTWLRTVLSQPSGAWTPDHLATRRAWRRVDTFTLRPGSIVVVASAAGGYRPETGWDGSSKLPVPVVIEQQEAVVETTPIEETTADDPATFTGSWVGLDDHLADAEQCAYELLAEARMTSLTPAQIDAVVRAASLHDVGKAHDIFQDTLLRSAREDEQENVRRLAPLAKSGGSRRTRHRQPHFRHELVSALMLGAHENELFGADDIDRDLVRYLVAAHHGRVRLAIRSVPGEAPPRAQAGSRIALGVVEGDVVPAVTVRGTHLEPTTLRLDEMALGGATSWTAMALGLRDREDLGPFRLATLEALVRVADWRASATPAMTIASPARGSS